MYISLKEPNPKNVVYCFAKSVAKTYCLISYPIYYYNIYFRFRFGLVNAINTHSRLTFVLCFFFLGGGLTLNSIPNHSLIYIRNL